MKISKSIKTKEGQVQFDGELGPEELDLVIGLGLNLLLQQGAIPFKRLHETEIHAYAEGSETEQ